MFRSRSIEILPMKGTVERETRARVAKALAVKAVVAGFSDNIGITPEYLDNVGVTPDSMLETDSDFTPDDAA